MSFTFKYIDLCCGVGGFHMAIERIKDVKTVKTVKNVKDIKDVKDVKDVKDIKDIKDIKDVKDFKSKNILSADIDKNCRIVYKNNHLIEPKKDIKDIVLTLESLDDFHGLFAGFPCQPFSMAGKKLGLDDRRGTVIYDILNIIKHKKPWLICLENVKGLKTLKNKDKDGNIILAYKKIYSKLNELGYSVVDRVISPHEINIPQKRERVVICAIRNDKLKIESKLFLKEFKIGIEKLILNRKEENKDYKVFENKKVDKKFFLKDDEKRCIEIWEEFVSMDGWDKISLEELQKHYMKVSGEKKCKKNFKQEHFFFDFKYYKNNKNIPKKLLDSKSKKKTISAHIKKICDIWNILYKYDKVKKVLDPFLKKYSKEMKNFRTPRRFLEYAGGNDYGSKNTLKNNYCQLRMSGVRIRRGGMFPTLVKSGPFPIVISKMRYITFVEAARLQSFNEGFKFISDASAIKQIGNAVNVEVIELMLRNTLSFVKF